MLTKVLKIYTAITMGRKGGYYAVRTGRQTGVFQTWYEILTRPNAYVKKHVANHKIRDTGSTFMLTVMV